MSSFLSTSSQSVRQLVPALRTLLVLTVLLGLAYPLLVTGIAQVVFPNQADGSLVHHDGKVVGSSLIGQSFTKPVLDADGKPVVKDGVPVTKPDPAYFQSRPSAAGTGYDPLSTSASNLGPTSKVLLQQVEQRRADAAKLDGITPSAVAPDALQASGSGLDPQISPEYADQQVARVAKARGMDPGAVEKLVDEHTLGRTLAFIGEPRVNVVQLNLALDAATASASAAD